MFRGQKRYPEVDMASETAADQAALAELDNTIQLVNDRVRAVVDGYQTGLYLCGAGGLGKSYNVLKQLEALEADFRVFNARMTGKGLFQTLERAPEAIHVLEDMERLTHDRDAQGVLRRRALVAAGAQSEVTWTTADGEARFAFRGGIIMLANRPLADLPELRALATRIAVHALDVSDAALAAQLRRVAGGGFARGRHRMDAAQCLQVCEHVIAECRAAGCPLDLRLLDNSCLDYLQWDAARASCHWRDLVANRVRQSAAHFRHPVWRRSREERLALDRKLVAEICAETADPEERVRRWRERTGKSQASFYRRKGELDSGEFD